MSLETPRTPPFFPQPQSLGEVGGDRREALNYIHGLYNYTFKFPLVVGFKRALSNFDFEMLCFPAFVLSPLHSPSFIFSWCLPGGII